MVVEITKADLRDHQSISAIIKDNKGRILVQEHAKYGFVSIPMGKVDPGATVDETLKDELLTECDIVPVEYNLLDNRDIHHTIKGIDLVADHHMFEIIKYRGEIKNKEPIKHLDQYYITFDELAKKPFISHVVQVYLNIHGVKRDLRI